MEYIITHLEELRKHVITYCALLVVLITAIVFRIPRVMYVQGQDMFVLAAEAFSLIRGEAFSWLISPMSYLGMFSFSGYPFGSVALFALMLGLTGYSLEMATMLYVSLFCIISVISTYVLAKHLFKSKTMQILTPALYLFTPIVYEFTYDTASARAPLLAILPLFVYLLLQWNRGSKKSLLQAAFVVLFLMLFHRASFTLFVFLGIAWLYPSLLDKTRRLLEPLGLSLGRFLSGALVLVSVSLFVLGILTFGVYPKTLVPSDLFQNLIPNALIDIVCIAIDYSIFFGPLLVLSGIGLLGLLLNMWHSGSEWSQEMDELILLLFVFTPLSYFITYPAYTRHFIAILMVVLSIRGMKHLQVSLSRSLVGIVFCVLPSILYFNLYNLFWRPIDPYAQFVTVSIVLLTGLYILAPSVKKIMILPPSLNINELQFRGLIITAMVIVVTISYTDMQTVLSDDMLVGRVPTEEEIDVASFIRHDLEHLNTPSIVISQHSIIEIRIAAYAQMYSLADGHGTSLLAVGYVTQEDALVNSTLSGLEYLIKTHVYQHRVNPNYLWYTLMNGNWTDSKTRTLISDLEISYFVALKDIDDYFGPYGADQDGVCMLSQTISLDPVYETEHMIVYRLRM